MNVLYRFACALLVMYGHCALAMNALRDKQRLISEQSVEDVTFEPFKALKKQASNIRDIFKIVEGKGSKAVWKKIAEAAVSLCFNIFDPDSTLYQEQWLMSIATSNTYQNINQTSENFLLEDKYIDALLDRYQKEAIEEIVNEVFNDKKIRQIFKIANPEIPLKNMSGKDKWLIAYWSAIKFFYDVHTRLSRILSDMLNRERLYSLEAKDNSFVKALLQAVKDKALTFYNDTDFPEEKGHFDLLKTIDSLKPDGLKALYATAMPEWQKEELKKQKKVEAEVERRSIEADVKETIIKPAAKETVGPLLFAWYKYAYIHPNVSDPAQKNEYEKAKQALYEPSRKALLENIEQKKALLENIDKNLPDLLIESTTANLNAMIEDDIIASLYKLYEKEVDTILDFGSRNINDQNIAQYIGYALTDIELNAANAKNKPSAKEAGIYARGLWVALINVAKAYNVKSLSKEFRTTRALIDALLQ